MDSEPPLHTPNSLLPLRASCGVPQPPWLSSPQPSTATTLELRCLAAHPVFYLWRMHAPARSHIEDLPASIDRETWGMGDEWLRPYESTRCRRNINTIIAHQSTARFSRGSLIDQLHQLLRGICQSSVSLPIPRSDSLEEIGGRVDVSSDSGVRAACEGGPRELLWGRR